jgi:hypothetical protein
MWNLCVERNELPLGTVASTSDVSASKGGYTLVTLPRTVTPYRDRVDGTRDHVTYQKLVTRELYGHVRCAVGIWRSHQRGDKFTDTAGLDVQHDTSPPSAPLASFKFMMLLAPATNWEPHDVTFAAYCYAMRHGMKVQVVSPYCVSHLQRYGVTERGNVTSVYPP